LVDESGVKMSKSLGNFTSLTDLLDQLDGDGRPFRLLVLQSHYRAPMTLDGVNIEDARAGVARLDEFARRFPAGGVPDPAAVARFEGFMDDDLQTPLALSVLFEQVRAANSAADAGDDAAASIAAATVHHLARAFGLVLGQADEALPDEVAAKVSERDAARQARDWARSDVLRDELESMGWVVKDTPTGTVVHRR